jgi:hypothetical protein
MCVWVCMGVSVWVWVASAAKEGRGAGKVRREEAFATQVLQTRKPSSVLSRSTTRTLSPYFLLTFAKILNSDTTRTAMYSMTLRKMNTTWAICCPQIESARVPSTAEDPTTGGAVLYRA